MPVISIRIERPVSSDPVARRPRRRRRLLVASGAVVAATLAATGLAYATGPVSSTPSVYSALTPVRLVNARVLAANATAHPVVAGTAGTAPSSATSVVLSVDVSAGTTVGTLDVYPNGAGSPLPSMHWRAGQAETQQLTVPVGAAGEVILKNLTGSVTVTVHLVGYYAPPDTPTTYVTSPTSSSFLWNSQYIFETSAGSYTEYFTRYDDVSVPALSQADLDSGSLQVFMTPSPTYAPDAWVPLPYQFDSSFGFTYNLVYVAQPGHVVLMFYFIQTDPNASLPTLSTFPIDTYNFKIVITPNSTGASSAAQPRQIAKGRLTCRPIAGGKVCSVKPR